MSQRDENAERTSNMERLREEAAACGPGCACNAGKSGRARWIIGALVIVAAGTSTKLVQRYLNWNERSRGTVIVKKVCGLLVILGALYLLWTA